MLVRCPFYKFDDGKRRITCEGIIDDSSLSLTFRKKADQEKQLYVFCCRYYEHCEIYRMLMENKYS